MLRPDLRTAGGEVSDILLRGQYVGSLTLVFREQDRVSGSVQLEEDSLSEADKESVASFIQDYIQSFIMAVRAVSCEVLLTYSPYDRIIATTPEEEREAFIEEDDEEGYGLEPDWEEDEDILEMDEDEWASAEYELVTVKETGSRVDYHVYDAEQELIAEAFLRTRSEDLTGDVTWEREPEDWEVEHVTELLVTDFDEEQADTFVINHIYEGEIVETVELTHDDLLDTPYEAFGEEAAEEDYSVVLVRDDGDTLTYEIYQQTLGGLPIGTATVDIAHRQLTGFIDFRDKGGADDAEIISSLLMRELDKEKEYDELSLTLLYQNEPIDEIYFENETVH
ncbi:hypothetical protein MJA45_19060 [Paenibacillus aurantius]|uniref:Uncharacterized protein n=1 Tax=Paenibacillus aurantius TaxID=2918900 RepID=A0AA96LAT0_9BACL|nr:hypothetical protein [Paenibacillus aurantius]WNQ09713.1 hypothetical protein MJA45_19060 [Paenibacillus aurantius]